LVEQQDLQVLAEQLVLRVIQSLARKVRKVILVLRVFKV
jgi:hypothetical protein